MQQLQKEIESLWQKKSEINPQSDDTIKKPVLEAMAMLDSGKTRIVEPNLKENTGWQVNEWLKKAVLLYFRISPQKTISGGADMSLWWDKIPVKFTGWGEKEFESAGFRALPGAIVRYSSFVSENAVLMPCFVNIGAYIGKNTMIDTWSTVGSCAQIGDNCHISGGVGIGGVLEPLQANPVIIENNVFIGARSEIAEGVIVKEGAVISMGVFIGASTKIIDRQSGKIHYGEVPPYSVVIPGTLPSNKTTMEDGTPAPSLACAVIVKQVDEKTRSKTSINELLRN